MPNKRESESDNSADQSTSKLDQTTTGPTGGVESGEDENGVERRHVAERRVRRAMWFGGAAGILPLPVLDLALITGVQIKMLADLSELYGVPFSANVVKSSVASLIGGVIPVSGISSGSASLVKAVPLVGPLIGMVVAPAFAAATTWAVGRVFVSHFEGGGTLLDFDVEKSRKYFRQEFDSAKGEQSAA